MAASPDLDAILGAFMSPDNNVRRQAEQVWENMKRTVPNEVLEGMCSVMARRDAGNEGLRAMTAVLMRSMFDLRSDVWCRLQPSTKTGVKASLLQCLTEDPIAHIRKKVTYTIGQLAGVSASEAEWTELMTLMATLCNPSQANPIMTIAGLDLLNVLAEFGPDILAPHEAGLLEIFDNSLANKDIAVTLPALKATCSFLQDLPMSGSRRSGKLAVQCTTLVMKMMTVLEATINAGDEVAARDALEALNVIAAKQPHLLSKGRGLEDIGRAMLSLASSMSLEVATRELSLELVTTLCETASVDLQDGSAFIVKGVVQLTIDMLGQQGLGLEQDNDEGDRQKLTDWLTMANASSADLASGGHDHDEDDEDELGMVAARTLSRVAIAGSGDLVLSSALPMCSEFLRDASNWRRRKAGLMALLLIGEGCGEQLAESGLLSQIVVGPVLSGIGDVHPRVRYTALACVGQMVDDFSDWDGDGDGSSSFQGSFHTQLLPALVASLGGPNKHMPRLLAAAAGAVISFCNPAHMHGEWLYTQAPAGLDMSCRVEEQTIGEALLGALCELVRSNSAVIVKEEAIMAVGCVAQVLGPRFRSFYGKFILLAKDIFESTRPVCHGCPARSGAVISVNTDTLRGKAMETMSLMGKSVGREIFRTDAHYITQALLSEQAFVSRDPGNPQSSYILQSLARIAGVLLEEFLPYLDQAVTPLLAVLATDAEVKVSLHPDSVGAKDDLEAAGMIAVEMDLRGVGRQLFGVNTTLMQAKEAACKTLYQYTEDLGDSFAKHSANTLAIVLPNLGPLNAVSVQVITAAVIPRLVAMAGRRAALPGASAETLNEAQAMLNASLDALCDVVSRISSNLGAALEAGGGGDMESTCIAADSLSSLLGDHCKVKNPSPLEVSASQEMAAVTVLRDAAVASIRRSELRHTETGSIGGSIVGHNAIRGLTAAVDSTDDEEQEEWEKDLLTSAVDGIGWIIKGRREAFTTTFDSSLKPLVLPLLNIQEQMSPSKKSFGLCMCIDVLEHCGEGGRCSIFPALLPALLAGFQDESPSTRQACAYGLGVAADFGGLDFNNHAPQALRLLVDFIQDPQSKNDDNLTVFDNALSAAFRIAIARGPALASSAGESQSSPALISLFFLLLSQLPISTDVLEGQGCHSKIVRLASDKDPRVVGGENGTLVPALVTAISGMMTYQLNHHEEQMLAMGEHHNGGDRGCLEVLYKRESEEDMWGRQLLDKPSREMADRVVGVLRDGFPVKFQEGWDSLSAERRHVLQTPISNFCPFHGN